MKRVVRRRVFVRGVRRDVVGDVECGEVLIVDVGDVD